MNCDAKQKERLQQQNLIGENKSKQQQRFLSELKTEQTKEIQLAKKTCALEKETMKHEMIVMDLLKNQRKNIAQMAALKSQLYRNKTDITQYHQAINKSKKAEYLKIKQFLQKKYTLELQEQNYLREQEDLKKKEMEENTYEDIDLKNEQGETLSGSSLLDEIVSQLEYEKEREEKLSIKLTIQKQNVERLKVLVTCSGCVANENEEKLLKTHQKALEKDEQNTKLHNETTLQKLKNKSLQEDKCTKTLKKVQQDRHELKCELEALELDIKTLKVKNNNLDEEQKYLKENCQQLEETKICLEKKKKILRGKTAQEVARLATF